MLRTFSQIGAAFVDIRHSLQRYGIWTTLGWNDVRQRYRRSALGPWWLTISTGIMVAIMGPLYSLLFGQELKDFYPFLACGIVLWSFISTMITESCLAFISAEAYIKELQLPLPVYVLRVVWRNLIILGHNLIVLFVLLLLVGNALGFMSLLWLPGVLAIAINAVLIGITLGTLCARFRDIPQIVQNLVQMCLFITPIMWPAQALGKHEWVVQFNPFYHFLALARAPMLGQPIALNSVLIVAGITVANFLLALLMMGRFRARIAYWL